VRRAQAQARCARQPGPPDGHGRYPIVPRRRPQPRPPPASPAAPPAPAASRAVRALPERTLAAASTILADLPASLLPVVIAKSTARRGKGGRQPASDPRLDPSMDPKK
jgi:hypothetical protein